MVVVEARLIDGTHSELTTPIEVPSGGRLFVCVTHPEDADEERTDFLAVSAERLSAAYGESEPEYGLDRVKEQNPEYKG